MIEPSRPRSKELRARDHPSEFLAILAPFPDHTRKALVRRCELGRFFHVRLFEETSYATEYPDAEYVRELVHGLNVAGPVLASNVWPLEPDLNKRCATVTIDQVLARAWEYRAKTKSMIANECSETIYKDTIARSRWDTVKGSPRPSTVRREHGA